MPVSRDFLAALVNTLPDNIAVIDKTGEILFVNRSWLAFGHHNEMNRDIEWIGSNYLQACDKSAAAGDDIGLKVSEGLRRLINSEISQFNTEYPCDSPTEKRWFLMRASSFEQDGEHFIVVAHSNITERKQAEERVKKLSRLDDLTALANRRYLNEWLNKEWRRCTREQAPLCLAVIDIDYFKQLNDNLGHHAGDDCLKAVSELLREFTRRPNDICARYGGDEFILVYSNTTLDEAAHQLSKLTEALEALNIPNPQTPTGPLVTLSIGLACALPDKDTNPSDLVRMADKLLYTVKKTGRNRVEAATIAG
jgi:diguanylate cyclase (GGDEF)-like protein